MDLIDEYVKRNNLSGPLVKFPEYFDVLFLRKSDKKLFRFKGEIQQEQYKPPHYHFKFSPLSIIYVYNDFTEPKFLDMDKSFSEQTWQIEQHEEKIMYNVYINSEDFEPVYYKDLLKVMWNTFCVNIDKFLAINCPPIYWNNLCNSLNGDKDAINVIENLIKCKNEKLFLIWLNIKDLFCRTSYQEWICDLYKYDLKEYLNKY